MESGVKILAGEWVQWNNQVKEGFAKRVGKEKEGRTGHSLDRFSSYKMPQSYNL